MSDLTQQQRDTLDEMAIQKIDEQRTRTAELLGALMMVIFPRCGDHGGPLVSVTARYEDGSEITRGHEGQAEAREIMGKLP